MQSRAHRAGAALAALALLLAGIWAWLALQQARARPPRRATLVQAPGQGGRAEGCWWT